MNGLDADIITFECASTGGCDLAGIAEKITKAKIGIGVVDSRNLQVELPEDVAALIRKALEVIPAERLCITTDTGFGREGMSRRHAFFKMVSLVKGVNIVRREIGAPESYSSISDVRLALLDDE
jgi:5-methyltetrahydropteroyltriglutamate--homocysteine methyltransferase